MANKFQYGGQAVIEGVMMRGKNGIAVAVRRPSGQVVVDEQPLVSWLDKMPFFKKPFLRGFFALLEALIIGVKALSFSANQAAEEEEEELSAKEIAITMAVAFGLAIGLFVVLPTWTAHWLGSSGGEIWKNVLEGIIRIAVFLLYIIIISRLKDIQRVFQYHGAEHKVISTFERGEELTVENARKYSTLHPRCGTSFLLIVMVMSIVVFSVLAFDQIIWRILSRVLLMPLVAGIAYEIIKFTGKHQDKGWVKMVSTPGLWLQNLTTREPDDSQVAVAINSLQAVLKQDDSEVEEESPNVNQCILEDAVRGEGAC
ncbi:DUF1385 domain-containing protein [Metallumcola ferriviriculae]|uniref:DUF1385 domain-containing protein n=1 Tax=Metallumcola ferriviriculae TaxID=3039180 RepID=A0AAU0UKV5_9FIRM|nr:DUF1385 domain-containing protein [Desulfitibacteraceae bacterium MK1]